MDRVQKINRAYCRQEGCQIAHIGQCKTYWGKECNRLGGKKVPRLIPKNQFIYLPEIS